MKTNIPPGYKDSAVGIIPQEWEVKYLGDLLSRLANGLTYDVSVTSGYPVSRIETISSGEINYSKVGYIDNVAGCESYKMQKGDILYSHINSLAHVGKVAYYNGEQDLYHGMNLLLLRVNEKVDSNYLYAYLLTSQAKHIAQVIAKPAVNQASISTSDIRKIKLAVPPIAEQRKIAEILGVWDEAIEKQSRLIEKLELRKRALMQRLLTGRTRLPGFTTPWQKVKLGEIGKISSAGVDKKVNEGEVPVRLLNFVDVFYRDFIYNDELTHWVTAKPIKVEQCSVQKGDIFFTPSSEMPTDIAISAVAMEDMKGVVYSYHIVRLRPHIEMDLHYRAYAFKTDEFYKQAERICDGSGQRYVISQDGFRNMSIHLPSLPEQRAIAEVLTTTDDEIATHRKKLDALRLQKRGLMQQLLTGKTRVKI